MHEFFTSDMTIELYRSVLEIVREVFLSGIFSKGAMENQTRLVQRKGFNVCMLAFGKKPFFWSGWP